MKSLPQIQSDNRRAAEEARAENDVVRIDEDGGSYLRYGYDGIVVHSDHDDERFKELETRLEALEKILETSQIDTTALVKIARLLERGRL